jgi:uncharacterized protein YjbI with pentapeptide repeats
VADETHLTALKQGAASWNVWRRERAIARPDLSQAGLRGLDLSETDLSGADLRQADLRGAILSRGKLIGADLAGANVFKAVFDGADLSGANLIGAQFLNCAQLVAATNWQSVRRDADLACGAAIPADPDRTGS